MTVSNGNSIGTATWVRIKVKQNAMAGVSVSQRCAEDFSMLNERKIPDYVLVDCTFAINTD